MSNNPQNSTTPRMVRVPTKPGEYKLLDSSVLGYGANPGFSIIRLDRWDRLRGYAILMRTSPRMAHITLRLWSKAWAGRGDNLGHMRGCLMRADGYPATARDIAASNLTAPNHAYALISELIELDILERVTLQHPNRRLATDEEYLRFRYHRFLDPGPRRANEAKAEYDERVSTPDIAVGEPNVPRSLWPRLADESEDWTPGVQRLDSMSPEDGVNESDAWTPKPSYVGDSRDSDQPQRFEPEPEQEEQLNTASRHDHAEDGTSVPRSADAPLSQSQAALANDARAAHEAGRTGSGDDFPQNDNGNGGSLTTEMMEWWENDLTFDLSWIDDERSEEEWEEAEPHRGEGDDLDVEELDAAESQDDEGHFNWEAGFGTSLDDEEITEAAVNRRIEARQRNVDRSTEIENLCCAITVRGDVIHSRQLKASFIEGLIREGVDERTLMDYLRWMADEENGVHPDDPRAMIHTKLRRTGDYDRAALDEIFYRAKNSKWYS